MNILYHSGLLLLSSLLSLTSLSIAQPGDNDLLTANRSASLLTYSLRTGGQSRGGTNQDVTASASFSPATQQLEGLHLQGKISGFTVGVPTDDAHTLRRLQGEIYPDLDFVSEHVDYQTDEQLTLTGSLLFHGVRSPVTLRAFQTIRGGQLIIESMFLVDPTVHHLRPVTLPALRTKGTLQIAFMLVLPLTDSSLISQQHTQP